MRLLNGESRRSNARAPRAQRRRLLGQSGDNDGAKLDCARFGSLAAGRRLFIWSKKVPENFGSISLCSDCETLRFRFGFRFLVFLGRLERKVWLVRMIGPRARHHGEHMRMMRLIIAQILVWPAQCTTTPRTAS